MISRNMQFLYFLLLQNILRKQHLHRAAPVWDILPILPALSVEVVEPPSWNPGPGYSFASVQTRTSDSFDFCVKTLFPWPVSLILLKLGATLNFWPGFPHCVTCRAAHTWWSTINSVEAALQIIFCKYQANVQEDTGVWLVRSGSTFDLVKMYSITACRGGPASGCMYSRRS